MTRLVRIEDKDRHKWIKFCKRYRKSPQFKRAIKRLRKGLGFWRYHFTDDGFLGEFVILNKAWQRRKS